MLLSPSRLLRFPALQQTICLLSLLVLWQLSVSAGEKPGIDRLYPPGGQRGTTVDVKLNGKAGDGPLQMWTSQGQLTFTASEKADSGTLTIPDDAVPGIHWLRFYNEFGAAPMRPFVVGILPERTETEPDDRQSEAQLLDSTSVVVNGVLEKGGDVDVFSFPLTEGQTAVIAVEAHRVLGSPMDAVLQVLNERGTVLAQNDDDHGNDPLLAFTAPADGKYFARIFAFPSEPNSSIQFSGAPTYLYRLTVTTDPAAHYTLPMAVQTGQNSKVQIRGWNIPPESIGVMAEATEIIDTDVEQSHLTIPGPFAWPLRIAVVGHPSFVEADVQTSGAEPPAPFSITGRIDQPRERDSYWFTGKKDQQLRVRVIARAEFSLLDPVLKIVGEDGKDLKEADDIGRDNADAVVDVTLPADGRYRAEVRDRFDHGGDRFFYRLQCELVKSDYSLSVKDNEFVMAADAPLEIPVAVERKDGFAEPLSVQISGLPEGISAEAVRSEKDGDSSKSVTLKISGKPLKGFTGPVRIMGSIAVSASAEGTTASSTATPTEGENPSAVSAGRRTARSPLPVEGSETQDLWLTIPAPVASPPSEPAAAAAPADGTD